MTYVCTFQTISQLSKDQLLGTYDQLLFLPVIKANTKDVELMDSIKDKEFGLKIGHVMNIV